MLGIGLPELLLTACIGVIFVGPNEIPKVIYGMVKFVRKIKTMSQSLNKSVEVFMAETELNTIVDDAVFVEKDNTGSTLPEDTNKEGEDNG